MTGKNKTPAAKVIHEKSYTRFSIGQRWEHLVLLLSFTVLLLTGLPQKYRDFSLSQDLLSSPERLELIRQIHYIAAIVLTLGVLYHLGRAVYLLARRKLPAHIFPVWQDVLDAGHMIQYLLFLRKDKPKFGRYSFEQKFTYWFVFFGVLIMIVSGFIIWFPEFFTRFLPGGVVPAAKLAHSTEAIVAAVFILIWHIYHVHIERLNLSIFTGRLSESEMREFHAKEFERVDRSNARKNQQKEEG